MQRLKIVQCLFTFETGGAQVLALELLNEMCNYHDVYLIIINNKYNKSLLKQFDKRVKVIFINRKEGALNPIPILKLNLVLFKLKPDIIHCHEPNAIKVIKTKYGRLIYTIHDTGIPTTIYHLYDVLVAISDAVCQDVTSSTTLPVKTIFNGIPMNLFKQRNNYLLEKGKPIKLVQVSRLMHEKKGQDILLRALHKVVYEYGFADFSLDFIGSGNSLDYLLELTDELGLSKHVNFPGEKNRDWLFSSLSAYHLLIQPSRYEGFGLTILEGFAAGLPVIASDISGPAEIISGVPGGFLFQNENVAACAETLFNVLALFKSNKIAGLMSETIPYIKNKYSIESCAKKYVALYCSLVNNEPVSPLLV